MKPDKHLIKLLHNNKLEAGCKGCPEENPSTERWENIIFQ